MKKVLIVDDHALVRNGLAALLKKHHSDWIVLEASNGVDAILKADRENPDIVIMDHFMPRLNGSQAAAVISKKHPKTKILMISMDESAEFILSAIQAGVMGFLPKTSSEQEVMDAIREVGQGRHYIHEAVSESVSDCVDCCLNRSKRKKHQVSDLITDREQEIIEMLVKGLPTGEILSRTAISKRTLDTHKKNIFRKLQVHSTAELIRFAVRNRMVPY